MADWPREVERTADKVYWKMFDGTYYGTKSSVILPPPIFSGGYPTLEKAKQANG